MKTTTTVGYLEIKIDGAKEIMYAVFENSGKGKEYAYAKVKKAGKAVLQAWHGELQEDQVLVLETFDLKTRKWVKYKHE